MRKILVDFPGHGQGRLFNPAARDAVLDPFIYLRDRLNALGYQLDTVDDHPVDGCEWVWFWDSFGINLPGIHLRQIARRAKYWLMGNHSAVPGRNLYSECQRAGLQEKMVLFTGEPPVVLQKNWQAEIHDLFPIIFTWNDDYVDGNKYHKFYWPIAGEFPEIDRVPFNRKKLLVNISGNKSSNHSKELYSARIRTIRYFEQYHPQQFDLFGFGWGKSSDNGLVYPSYRGSVAHKWDIYPHYRFGVCYENMVDVPGWITEKIFDCMRADCVPIYWGASNITDFVDAETFIDRSNFASEAELAEYLLAMDETEYNKYRLAIRAYLQSDRFAAFLPPAFAENIIRVLAL